MQRLARQRLWVVLAYGAALLLSSGWHIHHAPGEAAADHRRHIVGEGPHQGTHLDSLPGHRPDSHGPECPTCVFLAQVQVRPSSTAVTPATPRGVARPPVGILVDRPAHPAFDSRGPPAHS